MVLEAFVPSISQPIFDPALLRDVLGSFVRNREAQQKAQIDMEKDSAFLEKQLAGQQTQFDNQRAAAAEDFQFRLIQQQNEQIGDQKLAGLRDLDGNPTGFVPGQNENALKSLNQAGDDFRSLLNNESTTMRELIRQKGSDIDVKNILLSQTDLIKDPALRAKLVEDKFSEDEIKQLQQSKRIVDALRKQILEVEERRSVLTGVPLRPELRESILNRRITQALEEPEPEEEETEDQATDDEILKAIQEARQRRK